MRIRQVVILMAAVLLLSACKNQAGKVDKQEQTARQTAQKKSNVEELTLQGFKEKIVDFEKGQKWVFRGKKPAVIDFYATWCGPCKQSAPILDSIAGERKQQIDVYKVDIDKQPELAQMFGIRSIPAFLFIPLKGDPKMQVGAMRRQQLELYIKEIVDNK